MTRPCGHKICAPLGQCPHCDAAVRADAERHIEAHLGESTKPEFTIKDSGEREDFPTGAVRDTQEGKPRPDLVLEWLPLEAAERVAHHYENGARKYSRDNWRKGIPASRCLASAFRHLYQWQHGDRTEDHLSAVVFNALCILTWEQTGRDDMLDVPPTQEESK